ncbi:DUF924 domain-containing protein [Marinihelvus fidelis]|uniref:DUF924 domain-containing protein n=1 Tax=Marinihelvus fidelis TaxID=2613842 RepID=A0A5N0T7M0_9GAMM|nr:DUF924 family protein [Marinihelvus fidelis]KAA9130892.1 DUF924 domain-containing protein [Marinihelvus fidelis]
MASNHPGIAQVLDFWFRELRPSQWYGGGEALDAEIAARFGALVEQAHAGELDDWAETALGRLALVIVLDQFSRNIFRGSPRTWAMDEVCQRLVVDGIDAGMDETLALSQRQFFYMPLMHAEDPALQALSVEMFTALRDQAESTLEYALEHAGCIHEFGRFPYRNDVLGRETTPAEADYLASDRNPFG